MLIIAYNIYIIVTVIIRELEKFNIPSCLSLPFIFLQVCLTPADTELIFSFAASRETPVSLVAYTPAQGLIEGVCSVQMYLLCVCVCFFLSFLMNVAFFSKFATNTHMHGCTHSQIVSSCATNIHCNATA